MIMHFYQGKRRVYRIIGNNHRAMIELMNGTGIPWDRWKIVKR